MNNFERLDNPTSYITAGAQTLPQILRPILENNDESTLNKVILETMDKMLISFGANLSYKNNKLSQNYLKNFESSMKFVKEKMFENTITYGDSGGFQVASGGLRKEDIPRFTDYYIEFLSKNCDYVFSLDIPPTNNTYENFDDIYKWNKYTYDRLAELPIELRKKILCVYHFRTTKIYDIWNRLFEEGGYFEKFNIWSLGGLVGFASLASTSGIIPYVIIIEKIVKAMKARGEKDVYIHILGSTAPNDILLYMLVKRLLKETQDINLFMTFDSSKIYKGIIRGKYFEVLRGGSSYQINYKSLEMNKPIHTLGKTPIELLNEEMGIICNRYSMKPVEYGNQMYESEDRAAPIRKDVQAFIALQTMMYSKDLYDFIDRTADQLYPLYKADPNRFMIEVSNFLRDLNKAKMTDSVKGKAISIKNSLDYFTQNLSESKVHSLIGRIFNKHEIHKVVDTSIVSW